MRSFKAALLILGVLCGVVRGAQPRPVWEEYLARLESPDTAAEVDGGVGVKL